MEKSTRNRLLQKSFTSQWKPRVIDYFAVCSLGTEDRRVETEGRFHILRTPPEGQSSEPYTPQLIDRCPVKDIKKFELPRMLPSVVLPYGVRVYKEGPSPDNHESMPRAFPVILTDTKGIKIYVAALRFREKLDDFLCRHHKLPPGSHADKCLCIVSHFPFLDTFLGMLMEMHRLCFHAPGCPPPIWDIIEESLCIPLPDRPDTVHSFSIQQDIFRISLPEEVNPRLPHVSYQALAESLGISNMLKLFSAALVERKILLLGSSVELLTDVAEALVSLLHPLKWMPVFVPVLPVNALECLDAPVTFIYGVCSADVDIDLVEVDKVVVADLDLDTVGMVYMQGREPTPEQLRNFTVHGIPELPRKPAQKLRRSLCSLTKPRVSNMMAVPHAMSRHEKEDLDLQVGRSSERWGPRHDERFQLAFLKFMAEILNGVRAFVMSQAFEHELRIATIFQEAEFLADRAERFGTESMPFYELLMETCGWPGFLSEEALGGEDGSPVFAAVMAAVGTEEEAALELSEELEEKTVVELERGTFKVKTSEDERDGEQEEQEDDRELVWEVYTRFPESDASSLAEARASEARRRLMKLDTCRVEEENARKELLRLDYMAKVHYHLGVLGHDPTNVESTAEIKQIIEACVGEEILADCFVMCMEERFHGEESIEVEQGFFDACKDLTVFSLGLLAEDRDYVTAAIFVEVCSKIFLRGSEGPVSMRRALKDLDVWREEKLWEHIFSFRVDKWEEGEGPERKLQVMLQLVQAMAEVGLPLKKVGDIIERLCGALSLKSQILLRDQFSQLQVLLHPKARAFVTAMEHWRKQRKGADDKIPQSSSRKRWMNAVVKVQECAGGADKGWGLNGLEGRVCG